MSGYSSEVRSTANASAATSGSSSSARTHPVTISCASLPVPQKSSGLTGGSPGSSSASIRAEVSSEISPNGTPTWAAASTISARSPPESWTLARPPGPARRPAANSARVSPISSRLSTRETPYASNSASYAPSSPASAPECAATSSRVRSSRPTLSATTGTSRSFASASASRNPSGSRTVSMNSPTAFVLSSPSAYVR